MADDERVQKFLEIEEAATQIIETLGRLDERSTGYETALQALRSLSEELVSAAGQLREVAAQAGSLESEAKQALAQAAEQVSAAASRMESAIANVGSSMQDLQRELTEALSQVATKQEIASGLQDVQRGLTDALSQVATKQEVGSLFDAMQSQAARDLTGLKRLALAGFAVVGILGVASLLVALGVISAP